MTVPTRRLWRASRTTLTLVWIFMVLAAVVIPTLAYVVSTLRRDTALPLVLGGLTVLTLLYAWRFGLHPQLRATDDELVVRNPFRTVRFPWSEITVVAAGTDGIQVGSEDARAEAWCVQKSATATRSGRRTRADRVVDELLDLLDEHDPPPEDRETGLRLRRARPDESRLLARMERAAGEAAFAHLFEPDLHPYPAAAVTRRWWRLLRDRLAHVHVLEHGDDAVGYVAFAADHILHLGVVPGETRRGYGSALLAYATGEIFASRVPTARLWVLSGDDGALAFYAADGWSDTGERRPSEFPPHPEERQLERRNPAAPRRSRAA